MPRKYPTLFPQMRTFLFVISLAVVASAETSTEATEAPAKEDEKRYIVFPGLDAAADEIAEWVNGFASPFNVYFGPKPYVVGWIGEGGTFGPDDPEIGEPDYSSEEDSYEDDEDDDDDDDENDPDFDPEDFYPEKKNG